MVSLMLISQRMPHHESLGWGTDEGRDNRAKRHGEMDVVFDPWMA